MRVEYSNITTALKFILYSVSKNLFLDHRCAPIFIKICFIRYVFYTLSYGRGTGYNYSSFHVLPQSHYDDVVALLP
jgi:hypothetical protein